MTTSSLSRARSADPSQLGLKDLSNEWATSITEVQIVPLRHRESGRLSLDNTKLNISVSETSPCTRQQRSPLDYYEYLVLLEGYPHGAAQADATASILVSSSSLIPRTPGARVAMAFLQWSHRGPST